MNQQLEILQHSIGAEHYGRVHSDRNYFITGKGPTDSCLIRGRTLGKGGDLVIRFGRMQLRSWPCPDSPTLYS